LHHARMNQKSLAKAIAYTKDFQLLCLVKLLNDLSNLTSSYSSSTLTDSELKTFFHCDRLDQLYSDANVISWHYHLSSFW